MDTAVAASISRQAAKSGARFRMFDWDKAAKLIRRKWFKPRVVVAGLSGDMEYTSGVIYEYGRPRSKDDFYGYLISNWATPVLVMDDGKEIECWIYADETNDKADDWKDDNAFWPQSALVILNGDKR